MKILIDMNLSPDWAAVFQKHGLEAIHWSKIGDSRAKDTELMRWARDNDHIVFTHDLDFGTVLALTNAESPSVIQVRTQDVSPAHLEKILIEVLLLNAPQIESGALIVIDEGRLRVRILPLG